MQKDFKTILVDMDGVLCNNTWGEYNDAQPYQDNINVVNILHDKGYKIVVWTARGSGSGLDWYDVTRKQLDKWGVKYHEVRLGKPNYDLYIDDKCFNPTTKPLYTILEDEG